MWAKPAVIAITPLASPLTATGVGLLVVLPLPSWPSKLLPQHCTPPPLVRAQVWEFAALIASTPLASPLTATGVGLSLVLPLPSWPEKL